MELQLLISLTLNLFYPVHPSAGTQSLALKQDTGVLSASVGDNVTLHCFHDSKVAMHFSWYRQTFGKGPELLSIIYKYDKSMNVLQPLEKNTRYAVERKEGTNHLHISDVQLSDSAFFFCGSSHSNKLEFGEGVFLGVKGNVLLFVLNIYISVIYVKD